MNFWGNYSNQYMQEKEKQQFCDMLLWRRSRLRIVLRKDWRNFCFTYGFPQRIMLQSSLCFPFCEIFSYIVGIHWIMKSKIKMIADNDLTCSLSWPETSHWQNFTLTWEKEQEVSLCRYLGFVDHKLVFLICLSTA